MISRGFLSLFQCPTAGNDPAYLPEAVINLLNLIEVTSVYAGLKCPKAAGIA
ncbi:hypothetical protein HM1_1575 [Heliomicrobium modesticaldum Ice1]|uniref:Uncharacterized protein n=1 Tax=Heliobacterium modesticaldum (strain ATCC 51547 / Ice1) TaxID=498761 RepID=B0TDA4_HELMI|nr:hypothetical protein HM1_1575 [Heliomicrobium modesticaldum Ice1]